MRARAFLAIACVLLAARPLWEAVVSGFSRTRQAAPATIDDIRRAFVSPPPDSRIMMRWWWFGPAVTKPELERELRTMRFGGIGGVEIQPVYPLTPDDESRGVRNLPFLSDEFIDALRFASRTAHDLGMRVDLTVGSGWPYGGPGVSIDHAAAKLRVEHGAPAIGAGERLIGTFENGSLFVVASRTGMQVKRPAVGAEGYVLDHLNREALNAYLSHVGQRLLQAFDGEPPYAVFSDSLEVYESDWSADFLEEFQRRRGYDLTPHLPELVASPPTDSSAGLREDWAQTLSELLVERYVAPMQQWAHAKGTRFRAQDYGTPPATLASNAFVDLSEGEGSQWRALSATRWASSANHVFGRAITSSETWTWLHSPVFRATPLDMKAEADLHFLQGVNQLVGHGWPYTAEGVDYPGWRFYAAAVFDERNPWWIAMPDIARYLQRVSFVLRQGSPANDVAIYLPNHDAWAQMSPGKVNLFTTLRDRLGPDLVGRVLDAGYGVDFFDDDVLKSVGHVEPDGGLRLGTNVYRVVILPDVERIPLETLRTLDEYVQRGGTLVATRRLPSRAPGYRATAADHDAIRAIVQRLFTASGRATIVSRDDAELTAKLMALRTPDVSLADFRSDIGFVHRHLADGEIYFVANTSNMRRETTATFRGLGDDAEWWDPVRGARAPAVPTSASPTTTTMPLVLEPYESKILVLLPRPAPLRTPAANVTPVALDVSSDWAVHFNAGGRSVEMHALRSWTEDPATRSYSGPATYSKTIDVPAAMLAPGLTVRLSLGDGKPIPPQPLRNGMRAWLDPPVREAAVVYVNDGRAGSVWCPPYSLIVTPLLQPGTNRLRIEVGNLAVNFMSAHPLPDYRLLNLRYGVRFEPQDMDQIAPVESGLLGPITLVATPR